jgi:hypothetical protein
VSPRAVQAVLCHARRWHCGDNLFHALVVLVGVAVMAESNQVHIGIVASLTSHLFVVYL